MAADVSAQNPVIGTVTAIVCVVAFVFLGRWQLERTYRPVDGYSAEPIAVPYATLVPPGAAVVPAEVSRLVTLTGTFVAAAQVVLPGHSLSGQPVSWVVTPLRLSNHTEVAVVRGWLSPGTAALLAPPSSAVTVTGRLEIGAIPDNPAPTAGVTQLAAGYVVRTAQAPPDPLSLQPVPVAAPRSTAPKQFHLQNAIYVVQWFMLAGVVVVMWLKLLLISRKRTEADAIPVLDEATAD